MSSDELSKLTFDSWLTSLNLLDAYESNFKSNLFTSMDRICSIWDDELTSILEIEKFGHRKRILISVAGKDGMEGRFGKVEDQDQSRKNRHKIVVSLIINYN